MAANWVCDLKEGDLIEVKDPIQIVRLAKVDKITREGELIARRRWNGTSKWGPALLIALKDVVRKVASI